MDNQLNELNELCNKYGVAEYSGGIYYYDDEDIINNHNQNDLIFTCLMLAIREKNIHSIQKIMSNPENERLLFAENQSLKTPFYYALEERYWEIAITLYKMGSNINHRRETLGPVSLSKLNGGNGFTYGNIYEFLCAKDFTEMTKIMLNDGSLLIENFFEENKDGISPFMIARIYKHRQLTYYLDKKYTG